MFSEDLVAGNERSEPQEPADDSDDSGWGTEQEPGPARLACWAALDRSVPLASPRAAGTRAQLPIGGGEPGTRGGTPGGPPGGPPGGSHQGMSVGTMAFSNCNVSFIYSSGPSTEVITGDEIGTVRQ